MSEKTPLTQEQLDVDAAGAAVQMIRTEMENDRSAVFSTILEPKKQFAEDHWAELLSSDKSLSRYINSLDEDGEPKIPEPAVRNGVIPDYLSTLADKYLEEKRQSLDDIDNNLEELENANLIIDNPELFEKVDELALPTKHEILKKILSSDAVQAEILSLAMHFNQPDVIQFMDLYLEDEENGETGAESSKAVEDTVADSLVAVAGESLERGERYWNIIVENLPARFRKVRKDFPDTWSRIAREKTEEVDKVLR